MKFSIIIPSYNEGSTLVELLESVYSSLKDIDFEIIAVDDGSTDHTYDLLSKISRTYKNFHSIKNDRNLGKTPSIVKALGKASGEYIVIQDADLEYSPKDLSDMIKSVQTHKHSAVYGSRLIKNNPVIYPFFLTGSKLITKYFNILNGYKLTDLSTGYKIIKKDLIDEGMLRSSRFGFCAEISCQLAKKGIKIYEYPISYNPRTMEEGKKIRFIDGLEFLWIITKSFLKR